MVNSACSFGDKDRGAVANHPFPFTSHCDPLLGRTVQVAVSAVILFGLRVLSSSGVWVRHSPAWVPILKDFPSVF